MRSKTSASRCTGLRCPSAQRLTRPACSSTFRCLEMACTLTSYGAASSPTVASPSVSRATRSRLVGSARAAKTCESESVTASPIVNQLVDNTVRRLGRNVNHLVDDHQELDPDQPMYG